MGINEYVNKWGCPSSYRRNIRNTGVVSFKCKSLKRNIILFCTMSRLVHPSSKHMPAGHHAGSRTFSFPPLCPQLKFEDWFLIFEYAISLFADIITYTPPMECLSMNMQWL